MQNKHRGSALTLLLTCLHNPKVKEDSYKEILKKNTHQKEITRLAHVTRDKQATQQQRL